MVGGMTGSTSCIGVIAPFSTEESVVAGPLLAAVEVVVEASGLPVRVVAHDDGRDPDRAVEAMAALAAEPRCIGVVGPKNSGSALAVVALAAEAGLPVLLPCATADELTAAEGVVFRLCAPDRATAAAAVALTVERGIHRLAVFADDTAYGQHLAADVRVAADGAPGLDVVESVERADAAFLAMGEVEQSELMKQLRRRDFSGVFVSAEGGPGAPIVELAGAAAEGAWLLYPGTPVEGRSVYAAEAADAARVLLAAGTGGAAAIRAGSFEGETGRIDFTATGERQGATVARYQVVDGVVQLTSSLSPVPTSDRPKG
jgi:branched-chain amino acid transport system substrate-binding protein